jgi:hypothetical protein
MREAHTPITLTSLLLSGEVHLVDDGELEAEVRETGT